MVGSVVGVGAEGGWVDVQLEWAGRLVLAGLQDSLRCWFCNSVVDVVTLHGPGAWREAVLVLQWGCTFGRVAMAG